MEKIVVPGYYRHFKGNIYRTLHVVKHSETGEDMVIYQAMYGKGEKWARPKSMFMDEGRFTCIPDKEAILLIPLELNPKYHFPDLDYIPEMIDLADTKAISAPVKGLMTLLTNKKIVPENFFDAFQKDDDVEKEALKRIAEYINGESLEEIFHLIQVWGGASGRGVYIFGDGFDWNKILPHYSALVHCCLSTKDTSQESIDKMVKAVCEFNKSVAHMGVAFITKHTRFWLCRTLCDDTLPIYDSIMADCVMRKNTVDHNHLTEYWTVMLAKSKQLGIGLKQLERQIFKYAYDKDFDPAGWFRNCYGIVRDPDVPVEKVVIRAFGYEANYLRDLPFHPSQKEIAIEEGYSDFELTLSPTADFWTPLLSRGSAIKILQPQWLADEIKCQHLEAAKLYEK